MKTCSACNISIKSKQNFKKHCQTKTHLDNLNKLDFDIENIFSEEKELEMYSLVPHTKKRSFDEFQEFTEATQYLKKLKENNTDPKDIQ